MLHPNRRHFIELWWLFLLYVVDFLSMIYYVFREQVNEIYFLFVKKASIVQLLFSCFIYWRGGQSESGFLFRQHHGCIVIMSPFLTHWVSNVLRYFSICFLISQGPPTLNTCKTCRRRLWNIHVVVMKPCHACGHYVSCQELAQSPYTWGMFVLNRACWCGCSACQCPWNAMCDYSECRWCCMYCLALLPWRQPFLRIC